MNSDTMQEAMTTGDVTEMAEAMNTPEIKAIMGEEHVNQMTEYMKNGSPIRFLPLGYHVYYELH